MDRKSNIILGFLSVSFIFYFHLNAQTLTFFTASVGLVDNTVYSVFEDNDNNLWFGTSLGLARFDGINWEEFTQSNSRLVNNKVNSILQDHDGHLWFGTDNGISEFYNENWHNYTHEFMPAYIREQQITVLFLDTKNNLWIGTKGGGVTKRFRNAQEKWEWKPYDTAQSGIISDYITTINEDSMGNLWFGTMNSGICKFDGDSNWTSYSEDTEFIGNKIHVIFKDHSDMLWIGTNNGLFRTGDGTRWFSIGPIPAVQSIAEDRDGNLWLGTENDGLYKYDRKSYYKPPIQQLESVPIIWSMIRDHTGYLWLGTNGAGVARLHLNWQTFNKSNSGLVSDIITGVTEDKAGNIWVASARSGIARFNGVSFDTFNVDGNLRGTNFVNSMMADNDNWIWCATENGAHRFHGNLPWISYYDSLAHTVVNTIIQDHNGAYWFGTWGGVSRFDGNSWTTFDTSDGLPDMIITKLWEDQAEYIWLGTANGGVCQFAHDTVVTIYNESHGLLDNHVTAIIQDKAGAYWFGTPKGINRFDGTNWEYITRDNSSLTQNYINCLFNDWNDNIWIGTQNGGLHKFDGQFWVDFSGYVPNSSVNAIFQDMNKNFWIGTNKGVVKYTPDKIAPQTFITIPPDNIIGDRSALFVFSGIDTETPKEKLVYSWNLQNHQFQCIHNWSEYSYLNYCEVYFPANSSYIFSVKARDENGNEDKSPASYHITVDTSEPKTFIIYPTSNEIISGKVAVVGTAFDSASILKDFKHYWLDYAAGDSLQSIRDSDWCNIINDQYAIHFQDDTFFISTPIINDTLIVWDTRGLFGSYFLRLSAQDTLDHISDYTVKLKIVETIDQISKDRGGSLKLADRIQLYIPPKAMENETKIHFSPVKVNEKPVSENAPIKYSKLAYNIGPDSIRFHKPAMLTLYYDDDEITNLNETKLSLMYINSSISDFDETDFSLNHIFVTDDSLFMGGFTDAEHNMIRTSIQKLGTYILVEDNTGNQGQHVILEVNCQPRIFSPTGTGFAERTIISFRLAVDSNISIKIYNLAGRLVCNLIENEMMHAGYNPIEWDGRDYNGRICPSDLYIVTIENDQDVKTKTVMILDKS